ncbi:MAG: MarR family transcriptional regulator [Actinobacteria bacterium]|nr:MAG: MarR family transcriptional regulator [Actinomycetota bacterium]TML23634.1 MAG: MarR family transcriptional regulator [Actinomycetota bacterium]
MTLSDPQTPLKPPFVRPPKELRSSTAHLLKRLGWAIKDRSIGAYEATGLSPYHHAVLAVLDEGPPETQAMIADALGYDRSHLVGLLDELEERGLIERRRDPSDRRRHLVKLTPEGKRTLNRFRAIAKSVDDEFFAPLDAEQREALHALLLQLASHHDPRYATAERNEQS